MSTNMAKFHLSFIIGFSLVNKEGNKKGKNKKQLKSKEVPKKLKDSKSSKGSKKNKAATKSKDTLPQNTIFVEKPIKQIHIEYNLIPKKLKFEIDVVCWGHVAKV